MKRYKQTPKGTLPSGALGFPEIKETDLAEVGQFAQEGDKAIVADFIRKAGGALATFGGDYQLTGGLSLNIYKPLRVWRADDGAQFEHFDASPTALAHATADADNPRVDVIYATLAEDVDAATATRHCKLDPTDAVSEEGDVTVAEEKRNTLTLGIAEGTPAATPSTPAIPANSVALYEVTISAGLLVLSDSNIHDVRLNFPSLEEVYELVETLINDVNDVRASNPRVPADHVDIGDGAGKFANLTAQQAFNILGNQDDTQQNDPIFRPEILTPELHNYAAAAGKLGSAGATDGSTPVVDIPAQRRVSFFGGKTITIEPSVFPATVENVAINAHYVDKHVDEATNTRQNTVNLSLAGISAIDSDGKGDYLLAYTNLAASQARSAAGRNAAARDGRYIEFFGGTYLSPNSSWFTFDTQANTVTPRTFDGDIPTNPILFAAPLGDGRVLLAEAGGAAFTAAGATLRWYVLTPALTVNNCVRRDDGPTGTVGDFYSVKPGVVGDLIQSNLVLMLVSASFGSGNDTQIARYYAFKADTDSFEQVAPIGQGPGLAFGSGTPDLLRNIDACIYKSGTLMFLQSGGQQRTVLLDYGTRTFTNLNIAQPSSDKTPNMPITTASVANVNGRPQMLSEFSSVWELTPAVSPAWRSFATQMDTVFGTRGAATFASLLSNGLPTGTGYVFGGAASETGLPRSIKKDVWRFQAGGIVQAACGLTLGGGATVASFVIDDGYTLPWVVGHALLNPIGDLPAGSIKLEVDVSGSWVELTRDTVTEITDSSANPRRRLRVTLKGAGGANPCIAKINETYEQENGPGLVQLVVRFNVVTAGVRYVYLSRDGVLTMETTAQQTTPDKCLLMEITPNGSSAPTPLDYLNQRWSMRSYTATRTSGSTPSIAKEWSVEPRYIRAWLINADNTISFLANPAFTFNSALAVAGLTTNGQQYLVELAG